MKYDCKLSLNAVTANTTGADVDTSKADKITVALVAIGGTVGGTLNTYGKDGMGNAVLLDTKALAAAATYSVTITGAWAKVYVDLVSRTNGTFTASVATGVSDQTAT